MVDKEEMAQSRQSWIDAKSEIETQSKKLDVEIQQLNEEVESNLKRRKTLRKTVLYAVACVAVAGLSTVMSVATGFWGMVALAGALTVASTGFCLKYAGDLANLGREADDIYAQLQVKHSKKITAETELYHANKEIEYLTQILEAGQENEAQGHSESQAQPSAESEKPATSPVPKPGGDEKTDGGNGPGDAESGIER